MAWEHIIIKQRRGFTPVRAYLSISPSNFIRINQLAKDLLGITDDNGAKVGFIRNTENPYLHIHTLPLEEAAFPVRTTSDGRNCGFSCKPLSQILREHYSLDAKQSHRLYLDTPPINLKEGGLAYRLVTGRR
jgi:hypothetical protein